MEKGFSAPTNLSRTTWTGDHIGDADSRKSPLNTFRVRPAVATRTHLGHKFCVPEMDESMTVDPPLRMLISLHDRPCDSLLGLELRHGPHGLESSLVAMGIVKATLILVVFSL